MFYCQPAIKLLDFFDHVARADAELQKYGKGGARVGGMGEKPMISNSVGELRQLEPANVELWVRYWKENGFLTRK
jgi:hypothetical protein